MTQTTVRRTAPDAVAPAAAAPAAAPGGTIEVPTDVPVDVPLDIPLVPRPRADELLASPTVPAHVPVPADRIVEPRAPRTWLVVGLDLVLALAAAVAVAQLVTLPIGVPLAAAAAWPLLLAAAGRYRRRPLDAPRSDARLAFLTGLRCCVLVLALAPLVTAVDAVALAQLPAAFALTGSAHALLARGHRSRVVLVGRPRDVREALPELEAAGRHEVVAACLTSRSKAPLGGLPAYVGLHASAQVAARHGADAVVVLPGARLSAAEVRRLHWVLADAGTDLFMGTGLLDVAPGRARVLTAGGLGLVDVAPTTLRGPRRWVKGVVDRVGAALGLLLLAPVLLTVGLLVRADSPGSAIYRQQRVGRGGRMFTMYKFRSMSTSADVERTHLHASNEADGVLFKIQDDPRVTRVGRWLRKTSLDELPQLWNVLRGEMSLVGPRPALPDEVARYDLDPRRRLAVKPGMTGLWQVSGRSDLSWAESVRLDVKYVDNWSLRSDLAILARTVHAVLSHRGAY